MVYSYTLESWLAINGVGPHLLLCFTKLLFDIDAKLTLSLGHLDYITDMRVVTLWVSRAMEANIPAQLTLPLRFLTWDPTGDDVQFKSIPALS